MLPRLNYARFFLGDVLTNVRGKVLYLDTDTIVHGDVAELVDEALADGAPAVAAVPRGAAQESEIPNFKGSDLGRFPLVLANSWTSDHLSERSRSVDAFFGTSARGTLTLKRR